MKRVLVLLTAMALFGAMPLMAAEHGNMKMDTSEGLRQCALQAESIQEKIKRLETEIKSGEKKYNAKELKKLEQKLKDANKILDLLNSH